MGVERVNILNIVIADPLFYGSLIFCSCVTLWSITKLMSYQRTVSEERIRHEQRMNDMFNIVMFQLEKKIQENNKKTVAQITIDCMEILDSIGCDEETKKKIIKEINDLM